MTKKKERKTFFKIKEKPIFVPAKKFLGRKFAGIVFLICGSLILTGSAIYFYLFPNFSLNKVKTERIEESKIPFSPKRILVPALTLDFPVNDGKIDIRPPLRMQEFKRGEEILVLSEDTYRDFRVVKSQIAKGTTEPEISFSELGLKLVLPFKTTPPTFLIIEAEKIE